MQEPEGRLCFVCNTQSVIVHVAAQPSFIACVVPLLGKLYVAILLIYNGHTGTLSGTNIESTFSSLLHVGLVVSLSFSRP